jgi:hypothetical protein
MDNSTREVRISGRVLRIARLDAELYHFLSDPKPMIDRVSRSQDRIDIFTFMQGPPETEPKYGYPMEWDNLAVLPISNFENWWNNQIGFKSRNKAKQAERKGVEVREVRFDEKLVRGIWEIYNECPVRQGRRFRHYGKDLDTVNRDEATYLEFSTFIGAFQGEELIGFIKMVADETGVQAGLMNILSKMKHRDKAPTNALLAQAVRSCADRGISNLVYANYSYGNKQRDSLSDFKERNGFQRIDIPRYYVPLTRFGQVALRMGFHHRLADRIPASIAEKLRNVRKHWYSRAAQSQEEAS